MANWRQSLAYNGTTTDRQACCLMARNYQDPGFCRPLLNITNVCLNSSHYRNKYLVMINCNVSFK